MQLQSKVLYHKFILLSTKFLRMQVKILLLDILIHVQLVTEVK